MQQSANKIVVLHDDPEVVERVSSVAADAGFDVVRLDSVDALDDLLKNESVSAAIIDLVGPRSGGFELVERICAAPAHPTAIVVTDLDRKTIGSTLRLAQTKGLRLTIFRKDAIGDDVLKTCFSQQYMEMSSFGAADLADSIENYLRVEYQPKVPLHSSAIEDCGVEALSRITHPRFGKISPELFIVLAEKEGLIQQLTDVVVRQAFRDMKSWNAEGMPLRLALNVSPELLKTTKWCELFAQRCAEFDIEPERITLEITETSCGADHAVALDILTRLRLKGFTLSIDDFGTGFSSLSALYKLPFGELKIDKSFILDFHQSDEARVLIESTIAMAQRIGLKVVAEGVETEAMLHELRQLGCHYVQGYFISKSLPTEKIPPFFRQWLAAATDESPRARVPNALPKIAIIQSLLNDILKQDEQDSDETLVLGEFGKAHSEEPDQDNTLELARKIPSLMLQGKVTAALAICQQTVARFEKKKVQPELRSKVVELQSLLEREIACNKDIDIIAPGGLMRLLPRKSATIGRPSSSSSVDVAVNCKWFSRGDKQLRVSARSGEWFVEDLGSTNGSSIGARKLEPHRAYPIPVGETIIDIGRQQDTPPPISVRIRRPALNLGALVVTLIADLEQMRGADQDGKWPSYEEDLKTTWIIFDDTISLGKAPDCAFVVDACESDVAAEIRFNEGFRIAPANGTALIIEKLQFFKEAPLPAPSEISVGGITLTVRETPRETDTESVTGAAAAAAAANF